MYTYICIVKQLYSNNNKTKVVVSVYRTSDTNIG